MKHLISIFIATFLIAAAYFYQFGFPSFLSSPVAPPNQAASKGQAPSAGQQPNGPVGPGGRRRPTGGTFVTVADVVVQSYTDSFVAIGTGVAQKSISLVSEVSGQISEVHFDGTQEVSKGDILIQLEDESERINVEIAQANLDKAQDSLARYQSLKQRQSGLVSAVDMKEAEAAVAVAKGNLALAEVTLRDRAIRSPIDGKLGLSDWETGDYLSNGAKIVDINNTTTLLVNFELPERAIATLALGKKVLITTPIKRGTVFEGKVTAFDSVIDEATRTVTVKAAIDNKDAQLWPGMTFTASLVEDSEPLASIPAMALTWSREGTKVWVMENGVVQPLEVIYRHRRDDTIWVEGDLKAGTKVVVDGVQKLRPGAKVTIAGQPNVPARPDETGAAKSRRQNAPSTMDKDPDARPRGRPSDGQQRSERPTGETGKPAETAQ